MKRQKIKEMEHERDMLMDETKSVQETVNHLGRSLDTRNAQINQLEDDIEKVKSDIKNLQTSIDQQMLTAYEKEIAMGEIESLNQKRARLEKSNANLAKEINEGNREIHLTWVQNITKAVNQVSDVLDLKDQQENFEAIVKSVEVESLNTLCGELSDAIKAKTQELNILKESLRNEDISEQNSIRQLQTEYSTK